MKKVDQRLLLVSTNLELELPEELFEIAQFDK